jgi:phosphoserine phosphatase
MVEDKNYVVVTVSGRDRPGITASFTKVLVEHGVEIADVDQATLQDFLALSFLLDLSGKDARRDTVLKDLLFLANRLGMTLDFQLLSEKEVESKRKNNLFVVTFFGGTRAMAEISGILGEEKANIVKISNLGDNAADRIKLIVNLHGVTSVSNLKDRLMQLSHELAIDLALQHYDAYRKGKRIVFFDMDQTLLDMEVIDEMARAAGAHEEVARVTQRAMRGDMDFEDSLRQRVALLKGLHRRDLEHIRSQLRVSRDADVLVSTLKRLGYTLGVVSGGFHFFADDLKERLGLDFAHANRLEFKDDRLTGRVTGTIVDDAEKAKIVNRVAGECGVVLDQTVAVGDGANDRLMLGQAGLGIAYNAGRGLERSAGTKLGHARLKNILYILGVTEDDIQETP